MTTCLELLHTPDMVTFSRLVKSKQLFLMSFPNNVVGDNLFLLAGTDFRGFLSESVVFCTNFSKLLNLHRVSCLKCKEISARSDRTFEQCISILRIACNCYFSLRFQVYILDQEGKPTTKEVIGTGSDTSHILWMSSNLVCFEMVSAVIKISL